MEEARDCDGKTGKELFLELLRLLPSAQTEDYFLNGRWKDEDIQLDYDLLSAHRREAGAEDPPALEELEIPPMPNAQVVSYGSFLQRPASVPVAASFAVGAGVKPFISRPLSAGSLTPAALRPQPPRTVPNAATLAAAGAAAGGPSAELRQIAMFIAKWKLEATKTKLLLARLPPARRRWVMTKFAQNGPSPPTGQLEQYIGRCERENLWAGAGAPVLGIGAGVGLKRPLTPSAPMSIANKRPNVGQYAYGGAGSTLRPAPVLGSSASAYPPARTSPAWLGGGASAASWSGAHVGVGRPAAPVARGGYGIGGGAGYGIGGGVQRAMPKPVGAVSRPGAAYGMRPGISPRPVGSSGYAGTIKPMVAKAKGGRPGSLIANLLKM